MTNTVLTRGAIAGMIGGVASEFRQQNGCSFRQLHPYRGRMNLGTWIAIGVAIGAAMWIATSNAVYLGAGIAIGIALHLATGRRD